MHALKLEDLDIKKTLADQIADTIEAFLSDLGYNKDRISALECRSRDGFSPYSHNKGGFEAIAFSDQACMIGMGGTGFENADATMEKYEQFDIEQFEGSFGVKYADWTEEQKEEFDNSRYADSEATVLFSTDVMYQGVERGIHTVNVRMCVCVKDAPYHRKYDDLIETTITFRNVAVFERKLAKLLRRKEVQKFSNCLDEAF